MTTVREVIIRTLASFDISFNECLVADIEVEVKRVCHSNPKGLAYTIARNKAATIIKKRLSDKRRMSEELLMKEKERIKKEFLERLKKEFVEMESAVLDKVSCCAKDRAKRNIDLCFLRSLEGLHIIEIQERFYPDISEDCIRKGIQRGRQLFLEECISPELRKKLMSTYALGKTSF